MTTNAKKRAEARSAERAARIPQATAKYIRISSRKAGIVLDLIRGKDVQQALAILEFTPKAASPVIYKVLKSAVANAVNNKNMSEDELYVAQAYANPGPTLKRYVARSRGSASPMRRRPCPITVAVDARKAKED